MQEFWFCEACKSMNRGDADHCYRCRAPRARATMATIHERHLADVMMPGVDKLEQGTARAMLAGYPYNDVGPMGYIAAAVLIPPILFQLGFLLYEVANLVSLIAPDRYFLGAGWSLLLQVCLGGYGLFVVIAAVIHSVFLALTNTNVPSLGGGTPRFGTPRAAGWWIEAALWAWRANLTVWIPIYLGIRSMEVLGLFGLVFALALVWLAVRYLHNPMYSLQKPVRLLEDLTSRLALRGSSDGGLASMWSAAWGTARMVDVITPLLVVVGAIVMVLAAVIQMTRTTTGSPPASELSFASSVTTLSAALILIVVVEVVANIIALALLARLTLSLAHSQKVRRSWVVTSAGWPSGVPPVGFPTAVVASAANPPAGPATRPPAIPAPPTAGPTPPTAPPQPPPGPAVAQAPAPTEHAPESVPGAAPGAPAAEPKAPLWIRTQAEFAGDYSSAPEPEPEREPAAPEREPAGPEREPAGPEREPSEPTPAESPRQVLRPSSSSLSRYGTPQPPETIAPPQAPVADVAAAPSDPDWPEGM